MKTYGAIVRTACSFAVAALGALALGCAQADTGDEGRGESVTDTNEIALSYEEFKATHFFADPTDPNVLLLHGDIAVEIDSDAMRALYEDELGGQRLIVNRRSNGADDKWSASAAQNLRYCVSNNFGSRKSLVVNAMASAAAAWEQVANVNFVYVSSQDANCTASNTNVTFDVRQGELGQGVLARAFFPSNGRSSRNVIVDTDSFGNLGSFTLTGVMRHELGHTLGFRHEHTRPQAGGVCFENNAWRALTSYDSASVMHYPQCNGTNGGDLRITTLDAQGAAALYP